MKFKNAFVGFILASTVALGIIAVSSEKLFPPVNHAYGELYPPINGENVLNVKVEIELL